MRSVATWALQADEELGDEFDAEMAGVLAGEVCEVSNEMSRKRTARCSVTAPNTRM
jgi:hypothetical protein